ncbi:NosD domain-containing protein [Sinomonas sp. JGH33]|uniref:NosD domain-containing protein n=1 Tax=Sinomonas terricola TaxID=3110330 RepID=A0ABU5T5Y0_9MICC|nr:NosD domain-containing protein [Sinomonas sp. JGH33]MEA5455064.1 NosD domain-containing protein [Sinomonas sp. JGH33]
MTTVYDVTTWSVPGNPSASPYNDIGLVINSIIADIKSQQTSQASKPGGVIYIPPGDYSLKTRVNIDVSFLTIRGSGHGFTSLSIRYNTSDTSSWHEINPGGSRIRVENTDGNAEAFRVYRTGDPRLSAVVFQNFCLDGVSFGTNQNSYVNGKTGILFDSANDSCRIEGMGMVYLEHGLVVRDTDALSVSDNFLAECGNCVELVGSGQASKVTNNHIGAGYVGFSIFAENHVGLLVAGNNIFPRGNSMVHVKTSTRCSITANRLHAFYPGMVVFEGVCSENLISSNHFLRQPEPWGPMQPYNNGLDDLYGLVHVYGNSNTITANHFTYDVPSSAITPAGQTPTIILVSSGSNNYIAANNTASAVPVMTVVLDSSTTGTKVLDSGTQAQFQPYQSTYSFRATP